MHEHPTDPTGAGPAVQGFLFENHLVRWGLVDDKFVFVGIDVCRALGIRKAHQALESVPSVEQTTCTIGSLRDAGGRSQQAIGLYEGGVYRMIFRSRKPQAERFQDRVFNEILPAIRKTGFYGTRPDVPLPIDKADVRTWPPETMNARMRLVDQWHRIYGVRSAQWMSRYLGFPAPPAEMVSEGRQYLLSLATPDLADPVH